MSEHQESKLQLWDARDADIAERWASQYRRTGADRTHFGSFAVRDDDGAWWYDAGKLDIHRRLKTLDRTAPDYPDRCDAVIGNASWTYKRCVGCGAKVRRAVRIPDNEDGTVALCAGCVAEAARMLKEPDGEDATRRRLRALEAETEARRDAARLIYDLCFGECDDLAAHVLGNAALYLTMGDLYPGPYSRSPLEEFFAPPPLDALHRCQTMLGRCMICGEAEAHPNHLQPDYIIGDSWEPVTPGTLLSIGQAIRRLDSNVLLYEDRAHPGIVFVERADHDWRLLAAAADPTRPVGVLVHFIGVPSAAQDALREGLARSYNSTGL